MEKKEKTVSEERKNDYFLPVLHAWQAMQGARQAEEGLAGAARHVQPTAQLGTVSRNGCFRGW